MYSRIKEKVYLLVDSGHNNTKSDKIFTSFIITLIILNVVAVILETVESLYTKYQAIFHAFDVFSIAIFTLEFLLRLWVCTCVDKYRHPVKGRVKFIFSSSALIDLLAILPFYLPMILPVDLRVLRLLRIMRFIKFFHYGPYFRAINLIVKVFRAKKQELVVGFVIIIFMIIIASTLMYFVENEAQPDLFSSIPQSMWFSVCTLTTVGYGDVFPITPVGKTLTACISLLGVGLFALPAGILASGFTEMFKSAHAHHTCPHCGEELNEK